MVPMTRDAHRDCARCGKTLQPAHRFCPECGLPADGGSVLSTQIGALRERVQSPLARPRDPFWRRALAPLASVVAVAIVVVVAFVLFNQRFAELLVPPAQTAVPTTLDIAQRWEPQWVYIPPGTLHSGPPYELSDAEIDASLGGTAEQLVRRLGITNQRWLDFLLANETELRAEHVWAAMIPRQGFGWVGRDALDRPTLPIDPDTGATVPDDFVEDVEVDEIRRYWVWHANGADYYIARHGVTNLRWKSFLRDAEEELRRDGLWDAAVPGPASGWGTDEKGRPVPPRSVEVDLLGDPVLDEDGQPRWVEDEASLVRDVSTAAVRRFHDWESRVPVRTGFFMSRFEVRNVLWREFLEAEETRLRDADVWKEAVPGSNGGWVQDAEGRWEPPRAELDRPVRNVSARASRWFAAWLTARLGRPGWEIRLPTPVEWEYAARGETWNDYPWGPTFLGTPAAGTGNPRPRVGLACNRPLPVDYDYIDEDTSPAFGTPNSGGVIGMGLNVAEWVDDFDDTPQGRVYVRTEARGASFAHSLTEAERFARVWEGRACEPRLVNAFTGVRLVKVQR